ARSPAHAGARALERAAGGRRIRSVPRRRRPARNRAAPYVRFRVDTGCPGPHRRMTLPAPAPAALACFYGRDPCVPGGFCLQACPTFLATGDEADGPRGRIELMRAFERGELTAIDRGLGFHIDRCLGWRGCDPVCPSGVQYGEGLEE